MNILSANLNLTIAARSRSTQEGTTGVVNIGKAIAEAFTLDIAYAFKVLSAAVANVATLTHSTGQVAQTTGTPTITDGDGKDWEGVTLPAATTSLVYLILIKAGPTNTGTVSCVGADLAEAPSATLRADGCVLLSQPAPTAVGASSTLALTFSAAGDTAEVWVFAKAAA